MLPPPHAEYMGAFICRHYDVRRYRLTREGDGFVEMRPDTEPGRHETSFNFSIKKPT